MSTTACVRQHEETGRRTGGADLASRKCGCADPTLASHHDRLLAVETDVDELLGLFELAVTWGELDYSDELLVPPRQWLEFARQHRWRDPDRMLRVFSLATDIASLSARAGTRAATLALGQIRVAG